MKASHLSLTELSDQLRTPGLKIQTGPFVVHLQTGLLQVVEGFRQLYGDFPVVEHEEFADFHVNIARPRNLRRWLGPQVICSFGGETRFPPLPVNQAFPLFETSLNWYIYGEVYNYLILHAAAVERDGLAALLPAPPGSGKSTLTAGLVSRGWRLLTDELTLVSVESIHIIPLARPISLKNDAIQIIQQFAPDAVMGAECRGTAKGTIAYMRPPGDSVARMLEVAHPRWLIFPKYQPEISLSVNSLGKAQTFSTLASGLVNYTVLGAKGFNALTSLIDGVDCYQFNYSNLGEAVAWFEQLERTAAANFNAPRR